MFGSRGRRELRELREQGEKRQAVLLPVGSIWGRPL